MKPEIIIKINDNTDKTIDLSTVYLSKNNPRYTVLNTFEKNLIDFITKDYKSEKQIDVFNELFFHEGSLNDLVNLLESIYEFGFVNKNDYIYLIEKEKNYIVAEGNRRIMTLKLITGEFQLPDINLYIEKSLYEKNINNENDESLSEYELENEDEESLEKKKNKIKNNYKNIEDILENIRKKYDELEVFCKVEKKDDEIQKIIYDKHLVGERPGMRKWSRSKFFADLLLTFSNKGITNNDKSSENNLFLTINRSKKYVIKDYKEAQYLYLCFYYGKNMDKDDKNGEIKNSFINKDILDEFVKSSRISALERNHSYSKIVNIVKHLKKLRDNNEFEKEYFQISFDKDNSTIKIKENKIKEKNLFKFIFENWEKGIITTRPITNDKIANFTNELQLNILGIDINDKLELDQINEINEFSLSKENNLKIYDINKKKYKNETMRFKIAYDIMINNGKICKKLEEKNIEKIIEEENFLSVFCILKRQLEHNSKNGEYYLNALYATIRSFFEQILCWGKYNMIENDDKKENYLKSFLDTKNISKFIRDEIYNYLMSEGKIFDFINSNFKNTDNENQRDKLKEYINNFILNKTEINENIHASHKIYSSYDIYNEMLEKFKDFQEHICYIFDNLDWEKYEIISNNLKKLKNMNY